MPCRGGRLCPPVGHDRFCRNISSKWGLVPHGSMRRPQASFEAQPRAARLLAPKMGIDPYKRCAGLHRCIRVCRCMPPGGQGRPPLRTRAYSHGCIQICNVVPRGRGRTRPYADLVVWYKRSNSSKRTPLLLIRLAARATCPYPLCPCGTFPPDRGNLPLKGKALGRAIHHRPAPREIPRRGRNPFLVGQRFAKGRSRPHKLHVPRPAASGRSRSLRCSSSPNCVRSAGTQFGSFPLAVFLYTTSGAAGSRSRLWRVTDSGHFSVLSLRERKGS